MKPLHGRTLARQFLLLLLCVLIFQPSATAQSHWPIKDFEVFLGPPTESKFSLGGVAVEEVIRFGDDYVDIDTLDPPAVAIEAEVIKELESFLHEVAVEYERLGFNPPVLEPVVEREDGSKAYRVYVYDFPGQGIARYRYDCTDPVRPTISINARFYMPDGKRIIHKGYQDFPHELFHAVQRSYDLFAENCFVGDWIVEGTAQALGADIAAWSSRKKEFPNSNNPIWIRDRWGMRYYDKSLWIPDDGETNPAIAAAYNQNAAYGASSFWRYLAEWAATGGTPGVNLVRPDYRYMAEFFRHEVSRMGDRETEEIQWLDERMKDYASFKRGFSTIYPGFLATFPSYIPERVKPQGGNMLEQKDTWLSQLFPDHNCPEIRLSENTPLYRGNLVIKRNAATCYELNLGFWQPVDLHIEISGVTAGGVRSVHLGTESGKAVTKVIPKKQIDGKWTGSRVLQFDNPMSVPPPKIILGNVADIPTEADLVSGEIEISVNTFDHNKLPPGAKKKGPPPTSRPSGKTAANPTLQEQTRRATEHVDEEISGLNRNLANTGSVRRNPRKKPCNDAFLTQVCGPTTSIQLSALPPIMGSFDKAYGRGGEFAQFMTTISGMGADGGLAVSSKYQETLERAGQYDGVEVNITIPLIDYGFTGEFHNAALHVSKGGGGNYRAIGEDVEPGPGVAYPLAGSVVIEEYTPTILRGAFSGNMVDPDDLVGLGEGAGLPVSGQISGTFHVAGTWRDDPRIEAVLPDNLAASVERDVLGIEQTPVQEFPGTGTSQPDPGSNSGDGSGSSATVGSGYCDCSCNFLNLPESPCHDQCGGAVQACQGKIATLAMLQAGQYQPLEVDANDTDPSLRTLPNVCELMDAGVLASALSVDEVVERGPRDWIPEALSTCNFHARDNRAVGTKLELMFKPLDMYGSREKSAEELQEGVFGLSLLTATGTDTLAAPGNMAFVLHNDDEGASTIIVLTGIYGFGWGSEDYANELVLTYSLTHKELSAKQRTDILVELATPHVAKLQKLAVTTHQGT